MNHQNANPTNGAPLTVVEGLKQRRSSLVTLVAGVAILILSAASGYLIRDMAQPRITTSAHGLVVQAT